MVNNSSRCRVAAARTLAFGQTIAGFIAGESATCIAQVESRGKHKEETADTPKERRISTAYRPFACLWTRELLFQASGFAGGLTENRPRRKNFGELGLGCHVICRSTPVNTYKKSW